MFFARLWEKISSGNFLDLQRLKSLGDSSLEGLPVYYDVVGGIEVLPAELLPELGSSENLRRGVVGRLAVDEERVVVHRFVSGANAAIEVGDLIDRVEGDELGKEHVYSFRIVGGLHYRGCKKREKHFYFDPFGKD